MGFWKGSTAELIAATAAVLLIPFYLGLIHLPVAKLLIYSGAAGTAIASGEYAEDLDQFRRGGIQLFLADAAIWCFVVTLLGSMAYVSALLF